MLKYGTEEDLSVHTANGRRTLSAQNIYNTKYRNRKRDEEHGKGIKLSKEMRNEKCEMKPH